MCTLHYEPTNVFDHINCMISKTNAKVTNL
jgi:hypothetical protein